MYHTATVQIYNQGAWTDAAYLQNSAGTGVGAASPITMAYEAAYALAHAGKRGEHALSWTAPIDWQPKTHVTWPAYLVDWLPQGYGRQELLRQLGLPEHSQAAADWPLLLHGAGNPIGHVRIKEAHAYVQTRSAMQTKPQQGFSFDDVAARGASFTEYLASHGLFVAGSSGVQGEWPKILLAEDAQGALHLDHDLKDDLVRRHWLVKFARGHDAALAKILRLEATWMALAQHLDLQVHSLPQLHGRALFIERFDRVAATHDQPLQRLPQESLYALCGIGGFSGALSHQQAVAQLALTSADPQAAVLEYLRRDIANIALGNKDNHGRNTAVTRGTKGVALCPVFDFCPMYLHPDGIARRMRWEEPGGGTLQGVRMDNGMPDWQRVQGFIAETLEVEASVVREALHKMAERVASLPVQMKALGVDEDVRSFLTPGMVQLAKRLLTI